MIRSFVIIFILVLFANCKKETDVTVKIYNPALDEYVSGAKVLIFDVDISAFSSGRKDITIGVTDEKGVAYFRNVKFNKNSKHQYHTGLKESWGIENSNVYDAPSYNGSIKAGSNCEVTLYDIKTSANFNFQFENLLSPSQSGDSICFSLSTIKYQTYAHSLYSWHGGDTVYKSTIKYDIATMPYPSVFNSNTLNCATSRVILTIRKIKMGVLSNEVDTLKIYPNTLNVIHIKW